MSYRSGRFGCMSPLCLVSRPPFLILNFEFCQLFFLSHVPLLSLFLASDSEYSSDDQSLMVCMLWIFDILMWNGDQGNKKLFSLISATKKLIVYYHWIDLWLKPRVGGGGGHLLILHIKLVCVAPKFKMKNAETSSCIKMKVLRSSWGI